MKLRILILELLLLVIFLTATNAQNNTGWDAIIQNDFTKAKKIFKEKLTTDSTEINSLYGMIFLSEITHNKHEYDKYINTLLQNHSNANIYLLFDHVYEYSEENPITIVNDTLKKASVNIKFDMAGELFTDRKFDKSIETYRDIIGDYNWSIIGPFQNIAGSGHIVEYPIEKENFDIQKTYKNGENKDLKWVKRSIRNPNGILNFTSHLPQNDESSTYYANTYIELSKKQSVQFRIARNTPIKIWVNDNLIFDNQNNTTFNWDNEIITLDLEKGIHRVLVKCSSLPSMTESTSFLTYYDYDNDWSGILGSFSNWFSSYLSGYNSKNESFAIRITDKDGSIISNTKSYYDTTYNSNANISKSNYATYLTDYFKNLAIAKPDMPIYNYFLCKASLKEGFSIRMEAYFVDLYRKHKESVFYQYLAAKIYSKNGKNEKAYLVLNNIDFDKTPVYALSREDFNKIDEESEKDKYYNELQKMDSLYPWNYTVIKNRITYYSDNGMDEKRKSYIKEKIETYPHFKEKLEPYLEDENYKPYDYKYTTDKERKKRVKEALASMKKYFYVSDYTDAIDYYENKDRHNKVIALYDELLAHIPYEVDYRIEKAEYYYKNDYYNEAIGILNGALTINPYHAEIYELIGDVYSDKKEKDTALVFYQKAHLYENSDYSRENIEKKIEKIVEKDNIKDYFNNIEFDTVLNDKDWQEKYTANDYESVVLLYAKDVFWGKDDKMHIYQKVMIKILTEEGAKQWTEANFKYLGRVKSVNVIKNNGSIITPDKQYNYVVFKDLEPGDVIQIEGIYSYYTGSELGNEVFLMNYFAFDAPIFKAKLEIITTKDQPINFVYHKLDSSLIKTHTKNNMKYHEWQYSNLKKYENEDAVFDYTEPYAYIMASSMKTWEPIQKWYQKKTYRKLEQTYEIQEIIDSLITDSMSDKEKVNTLYNFITQNINYSYVPFLQNNYIPKRPGLTCSSAIGDCKDVSTLMLTMLKHLGIESYYTLVKTNNYYHKTMLPGMLFDHVIVAYVINGKMQFMDLTTSYYPHHCLNEMDNNAWALLIKDGENKAFKLPKFFTNPETNLEEIEITAEIDNRNIKISASATSSGIAGGYLKEYLNTVNKEEQKKFLLQYFGYGIFENYTIDTFAFENIKEIDKPLITNIEMTVSNYIDIVSSMNIFHVPYLKGVLSHPALHAEKRNTAIKLIDIQDITPVKQIVNLKFPNNYKLMEMPENSNIENEFFNYKTTYEKTSDGIKVIRELIFKQYVIEINDFNKFKNAYFDIVDLDKIKLSIKKH